MYGRDDAPGHTRKATTDVAALAEPIRVAQRSIDEGRAHLPLAVYFPTNRSALDIPARIRTPHEFDAVSAYDGALEGGVSSFRGFFEWFREEEDVHNELSSRLPRQPGLAVEGEPDLTSSDLGRSSFLPHVRGCDRGARSDGARPRIERRPQLMTIERNGTRLNLAQLSDGEKCLLAMTGDLARRMVLAAPAMEKPLEHRAVVLIDEIELHLHLGCSARSCRGYAACSRTRSSS